MGYKGWRDTRLAFSRAAAARCGIRTDTGRNRSGPKVLLSKQIDYVHDEAGARVVHHHISLVIRDLVTRRRRRQVSVEVWRQRSQISEVGPRDESADDPYRTPGPIDISEIAVVIAVQIIPVARTPLVRWTILRRPAPGRGTWRPRARLGRIWIWLNGDVTGWP